MRGFSGRHWIGRWAGGVALAYLGRKGEAKREGERGVAIDPVSKDGYGGCYIQHQLARIYKALDLLESLLKDPC